MQLSIGTVKLSLTFWIMSSTRELFNSYFVNKAWQLKLATRVVSLWRLKSHWLMSKQEPAITFFNIGTAKWMNNTEHTLLIDSAAGLFAAVLVSGDCPTRPQFGDSLSFSSSDASISRCSLHQNCDICSWFHIIFVSNTGLHLLYTLYHLLKKITCHSSARKCGQGPTHALFKWYANPKLIVLSWFLVGHKMAYHQQEI